MKTTIIIFILLLPLFAVADAQKRDRQYVDIKIQTQDKQIRADLAKIEKDLIDKISFQQQTMQTSYAGIAAQMASASKLSYATILISLLALGVSCRSYKRNKTFQDYEYATRIQIIDSSAQYGSRSKSDPIAIKYNASIQNRGLKPINITRIYVKVDLPEESNKSYTFGIISNPFYLQPDNKELVTWSINWTDIDTLKKDLETQDFDFLLCIAYLSVENERKLMYHKFAGFKDDAGKMFMQVIVGG